MASRTASVCRFISRRAQGDLALYSFAQQFGFTPALDGALGTACESCTQFLRGSEFLEKLHAKGVFDPEVTYTNIVLQDECRRHYSDHAAVAFSPNAAGHVLNALDPAHAKPVECVYTTPLGAP